MTRSRTVWAAASFMVVACLLGAPRASEAATPWKKANLTYFESYPTSQDECDNYNGCYWAGRFAYVNGKKSKSWVAARNIVAVHQKDGPKYKLKTIRLKRGSKTIDAVVYDICADSDCNGCCTRNANKGGHKFLLDLEVHTADRFGHKSGTVDWQCTTCN
jgi:hypothetical protein